MYFDYDNENKSWWCNGCAEDSWYTMCFIAGFVAGAAVQLNAIYGEDEQVINDHNCGRGA